MDFNELGLFLLGLLLRLGIPVGITLLVVRWLARLDARWQDEARREELRLSLGAQVHNTGCWDVKHCTPEQKAKCPAFASKEIPCWQVFRQANGALRERCIGCNVFKDAPVPITS
jgi:hypothetical protein